MKTRTSLCDTITSPQCPEVAISSSSVFIGEKGNLVRLKKSEWNKLVSLIQKGKLKKA